MFIVDRTFGASLHRRLPRPPLAQCTAAVAVAMVAVAPPPPQQPPQQQLGSCRKTQHISSAPLQLQTSVQKG
jgi:hypothetical protein